jgi:hypothetical protein
MSFAILRTSKLKTAGEIGGSLGHTFRIMKTPNADKSKLHLNEHEYSLNGIKQNIKDRLPEKVRKNGVRVVEYLITASPEWAGWGTDAEKEFFDKAKKWLKDKHGSENVVGLSIHRDETTPHLVAYVVPIDEKGNLNARHFLGGRNKLSQIQTDFAEHVKGLGLKRGLEGSKAEHKKIKDYYAEIQKPLPVAKTNIKKLEIEQKIELPKLDMLSYVGVSKKEYASHAQLMAYDAAQKQIDAHDADMNRQLSQMQVSFERKLTAEKMRADKFQKAHERAVYELEALKSKYEQEYAVIKEYKRLFPGEFDATEQLLSHEIQIHRLKIEEDKKRLEQARAKREYDRERALEAARLAEQNKEKDFKANIPLKRKMRLDAQYEHFQHRLEDCSSEPEKKAVKRLYEERKANFAADPIDVMNQVLSSDLEKSNNYFRTCVDLFGIKSEYDFKGALERSLEYFEQTAPLYQSGIGVVEGPVTRKVCAATSNWLDQLLDKYGSKYDDHAETLREHLLACDEKAEQSIFPDLLDYFVTEERLEKNQVKMAAINASRDFSVKQSDGKEIEKDKGFDFKL